MSRIISIVTLYYPKNNNINNVDRIAKQSDFIILCDNSSVSNEAMFQHISNAMYHHTGVNEGLSKAFNTILKGSSIKWNADDFILFFDQDTSVPENHISKLIVEYENINNKNIKIGCIGPFYSRDFCCEQDDELTSNKITTINTNELITSSMCIKYKTLEDVSWWNEHIFLDLADWDLCWRLQAHGYKCFMSNVSIIEHKIGRGEKKIGFFTLKIGEPIREYYQLRDCSKLILKKYVPIKFKLRFILMFTIRPLLHVLFLDKKIVRIRYMLKGIKDGLENKDGALL